MVCRSTGQAMIGLEPLPLPVDETEQRDGSIADLRRECCDAVKERIGQAYRERRTRTVRAIARAHCQAGMRSTSMVPQQDVERPFNEGQRGRILGP